MNAMAVSIEDASRLLNIGATDVRRKIRLGKLDKVETEGGGTLRVSLWSIYRCLGMPEDQARLILIECLDLASCSEPQSSRATHGLEGSVLPSMRPGRDSANGKTRRPGDPERRSPSASSRRRKPVETNRGSTPAAGGREVDALMDRVRATSRRAKEQDADG